MADRFAAHVYGWESDRDIAEERLRQETERDHLTTKEGEQPEWRTQSEIDRSAVEHRVTSYEEMRQVEREVIRFRAFFDMRDHEEAFIPKGKRGEPITHYSVVFSFDQPISNKEIKELVDRFCESKIDVLWSRKRGREFVDNPLQDAPAGFAIHRDGTEHTHCHGQWDCRLPSGRKVQIPPQVWQSLDEHWARIWSDHVRDPNQFLDHIKKKEETLNWKREARERKAKGLQPGPKPQREADLRDQKALKLSSQIKTDLRTLGLNPEKFHIIVNLRGYRSNEATRKLMAQAELAQTRFLHAIATDQPTHEVSRTNQEATALNLVVQAMLKAREARGKAPPTLYYTDKQYTELQKLKGERLAAAKDDRLARILSGYHEYIRLTTHERCAQSERFLEERGGVYFELEDGGRWSLHGIEDMIERETERLGTIGDQKSQKKARGGSTSTLYELKECEREIQKKIAVREKQLLHTAEAARWRLDVVSRVIEESKEVRAQAGKSWPGPIYSPTAYRDLDQLAHRTRDTRLTRHLHGKRRDVSTSPEIILATAEIEFGRELVARKELLQKEASYREASERKSSSLGKTVSDLRTDLATPIKQVVAEYQSAREYYQARREIVKDYLRALGLSRESIVPRLSSVDLTEIKRYSESIKPNKENKDLIRHASRARLHEQEQIIVEEKPATRDKEPQKTTEASRKRRIRDARAAIEKLLIESTRTDKGALRPVETALQVAKAAREELVQRGVKLEEAGYTREQWTLKIVDQAVRALHQYCLSSGSGEHDYPFKQSQALLDAANRNEPALLVLVAGPANSEGERMLDSESLDPKEEPTLLKTRGISHAEDIQLSTKDSHLRAGLIQGQYIEEYLKVGFLDRAGVVLDKGNLEDLRLKMMDAKQEHLKRYGGLPLAILSKEQKELAQSYKEMGGHLPEQIQNKLQDCLVIGESRADSRLERELVHEHVKEFVEVISR
ncbi:MAG: hypothetical protein WCB68_15595 [Pyrinomonadaceae bacterium]